MIEPIVPAKKSSASRLAVVLVQSADAKFSRELNEALIAAGLTVKAPAEPTAEESVVLHVLDDPEPAVGSALCRSIVLSSARSDALDAQALRHGAAALLAKPVSIPALVTEIRLAVQQLLELDTLRRQVDKLSALLNEEQTVSLAVGMIAERFDLPPMEAYERLRRHARSTQSKLQAVAAQVVSNASSANQLLRTIIASTEGAKQQPSLATD